MDWVRNLAANPACTVRIGRDGEPLEATGRLLDSDDDGEEATRAAGLVFEKYQPRYGGDLTDWRGRSLVVAIDLD
jgi:hypothetical protein